jgi:hypothetical protein
MPSVTGIMEWRNTERSNDSLDQSDRMQIRLTLTRQKHAEAMEILRDVSKYWRSDFIARAIVLLGKQEGKSTLPGKADVIDTGVADIFG